MWQADGAVRGVRVPPRSKHPPSANRAPQTPFRAKKPRGRHGALAAAALAAAAAADGALPTIRSIPTRRPCYIAQPIAATAFHRRMRPIGRAANGSRLQSHG